MALEFNRDTLIRFASILLLIVILPAAAELLFVLDVFGLEFTLSFMFLYLGYARERLVLWVTNLQREIGGFIMFIASLYLFQPRVLISHSIASSILISLTCSLMLATLFWLPAFYLSMGYW